MNIVYKITLKRRKENNIEPYCYIGSKTNCTFENGIIYDKSRKQYYGSSRWAGYNEIIKEEIGFIDIEILVCCISSNSADLIDLERYFQIEDDVVRSTSYFNKSYPAKSNYSDPNYATFKHSVTGKVVRLLRDDHMVLDGTYVGVTKGNKQKPRKKLFGPENHFYGKKHKEESIKKIIEKRKLQVITEESRKKMSDSRKGVKKSVEHKKKIGRKGLCNYINLLTNESIRIEKTVFEANYNKDEWVTLAYYNNHYKKIPKNKKLCDGCGDSFLPIHYERFHGTNCKKLREEIFEPWATKRSDNGLMFYQNFLEVVEFLKNNKKLEGVSSKKYALEVLIPYAKNRFNVSHKSVHYNVFKKIICAFFEGIIDENCLESYKKWRENESF